MIAGSNPCIPPLNNNYPGSSTNTNNSNQFLGKIDQTFSNSSQLSVSYSWHTNPVGSPDNTSFGPILSQWFETQHGDRAIVNWNKSLSTNKLNHFMAAFNIFYFVQYHGGQKSRLRRNGLNAKAGLRGGIHRAESEYNRWAPITWVRAVGSTRFRTRTGRSATISPGCAAPIKCNLESV